MASGCGRSMAAAAALLVLGVGRGAGAQPAGLPPAPTTRLSTAGAEVGGRILVIGGFTTESVTGAVEIFDPRTRTWTTGADMPTRRGNAEAVGLGGHVYVIGGRNTYSVMNVVERYDPASDTWEARASMPTARWNLMATALGGKIYAIGGIAGVRSQRTVLDVVEVYDPATDTWASAKPLPEPRSSGAAAALGSLVYVVSGKNKVPEKEKAKEIVKTKEDGTTPRVDAFDARTGRWQAVAPVSAARNRPAACTLAGRLYVIGGGSGRDGMASVEAFDPASGAWSAAGALATPRGEPVCAAVGGEIFVIGGWKTTNARGILRSVETLRPGSG